ncbi:neuromedin U [Thalassoglobus sp. JC818]|uniref:neuromedin U n=1 Tax=Thalassoglobus sp. JC818 TaxID=3232136 RepID=UPI00345AE3FB
MTLPVKLVCTLCLVVCSAAVVEAQEKWLSFDGSTTSQSVQKVETAVNWETKGTENSSWFEQGLFGESSPDLTAQLADESSNSILLVQGAGGEAGGGGSGDLAAKSQNPISDLVSLPLQSNWDFGIGPGNDQRYIGNLQPVIPIKLNEDWNLINRVIIPFVNLPTGLDEQEHGIGNVVGQFFFSPRNAEKFIWGVGPTVQFPTASTPNLGAQEWAAGVDAVAVIQEGPILTGVLITQLWGSKGHSDPFLAQPFFNYNLPEGWFLNVSGEANADWTLPRDSRWSFPLGGGVGRVFPILGQPVNVLCRFAPYVISPDGGPDWQFRFQFNLLFPK